MRRIIFFVLVLLFPLDIFAGSYFIQGYVRDAQTHMALPYANISVGGTRYGTASNMNGEFTLRVDSLRCELIVRILGTK